MVTMPNLDSDQTQRRTSESSKHFKPWKVVLVKEGLISKLWTEHNVSFMQTLYDSSCQVAPRSTEFLVIFLAFGKIEQSV